MDIANRNVQQFKNHSLLQTNELVNKLFYLLCHSFSSLVLALSLCFVVRCCMEVVPCYPTRTLCISKQLDTVWRQLNSRNTYLVIIYQRTLYLAVAVVKLGTSLYCLVCFASAFAKHYQLIYISQIKPAHWLTLANQIKHRIRYKAINP